MLLSRQAITRNSTPAFKFRKPKDSIAMEIWIARFGDLRKLGVSLKDSCASNNCPDPLTDID